jgi:hypothetical protein
MSGFFSFDLINSIQSDGRKPRWAVMFASREDLDIDSFCQHFVAHLESHPPPDLIYILAQHKNRDFLATLPSNEKFLDRLPSTLRSVNPLPVRCVLIAPTGDFIQLLPGGSRTEPEEIRQLIFQSGIKSIFQRRGGILPASPIYHYVKPSGMHSERFIRSAEVLVDGGEVDFIASLLLKVIDDKTDYIFCDSASISQLAYALMKLRKSAHPSWKNPVVDTFRSYAGIDSYDFRRARNPLCLISASTSGDMARLLSEKGIPPDKIIILFYVGDPIPVGQIVYDLTYNEQSNPEGVQKIPVFSPGACPLCKQGSLRVRMSRDHFVPESPIAESLLPKHTDAPTWLRTFLTRYHGTGTIRAHYLTGMRRSTHELFLDVQRALSAPGPNYFRHCLERVLTQSLPVALTRIIHLNDPASVDMANFALEIFKRFNGKSEIKVTDGNSVTAAPNDHVQSSGTTVVIGSCIVGGRSLMELSQVLRSIQTNGCLVFIVGVARFVDQNALTEAQSNVTHTNDLATHFAFHIIDRVFVPDNTPYRRSTWDEETDLLLTIQRLNASDEKLSDMVNGRVATITKASAKTNAGLENDLFWPTIHDQPLALRPNFAFFEPPQGSKALTQAEVFFTISSVLHNLRQRHSGRSLRQSDHRRVLIEPTTFYRLNDGVIQAALLRSALESEMDYRVDEVKSATMQEVLKSIFLDCDKDRGEGTIEFLMSLALRRLKLTDADTRKLLEDMSSRFDQHPVARCLSRYIMEQLGGS